MANRQEIIEELLDDLSEVREFKHTFVETEEDVDNSFRGGRVVRRVYRKIDIVKYLMQKKHTS